MRVLHLPWEIDTAIFSAFMVACLVTGFPRDFWAMLPSWMFYAYGGLGLVSGTIWVAETAWRLRKVGRK